MEIQSLKLVFFSPTGTTKRVIQGIARGINHRSMESIDFTRPDARKQQLLTNENDLLVVAVPVYMGRVPALLMDCLHEIRANNTPTVCVVVYGNREYDDALHELKDILTQQGCKTIAGAAFVGEHSFSGFGLPIAEGRPDARDINQAELFGRKLSERLQSVSSVDFISEINVPGNYPYGGVTKLWDVDFIEVSDACTQCESCAETCPVGAIDSQNRNSVDIEKCITCCACIKSCPQSARTIKPSLVKDAALRLNRLYGEQKQPEFFLN